MNKRKLRSILRRVLNESSGLPEYMEQDIIDQYEDSIGLQGGAWEIEVPIQMGEATKEFLRANLGIDPGSYMEEKDGPYIIFTYYGDPESAADDFDPELM